MRNVFKASKKQLKTPKFQKFQLPGRLHSPLFLLNIVFLYLFNEDLCLFSGFKFCRELSIFFFPKIVIQLDLLNRTTPPKRVIKCEKSLTRKERNICFAFCPNIASLTPFEKELNCHRCNKILISRNPYVLYIVVKIWYEESSRN